MNNLTNDQISKILSMSLSSQLVSGFGIHINADDLVKTKKMYLSAIENDGLIDDLIKTFDDNASKLQMMYN